MSYFSADENAAPERPAGFWDRIHPGVRSAAIMWLVLLVIAIINSITGGASVVFCYPVQLLLYVGNGALAGFLATRSGYDAADLPKAGAIAGVVSWAIPALFYLVFVAILGIVTLGVGFLGIALWILCGPVDLAIQVGLAALGASLFGRFGGTNAHVE